MDTNRSSDRLLAYTWSFTERLLSISITSVVSIVLARNLSAADFGLIGISSVFTAISEIIIQSGLDNALVRKQACSEEDYNTVFVYNCLVALICYLILFVAAQWVAVGLEQPILEPLIKVMGLGSILYSTGIIHRTIILKTLNHKLLAQISLATSIGAAAVGLAMVYAGHGVWSLAARQLVAQAITVASYWLTIKWRPQLYICFKSFAELWRYSSKLLAGNLIEAGYANAYALIIGRTVSLQELGYFAKADELRKFPSQVLSDVVKRVSFPILVSMQNDPENALGYFRLQVRCTMLIVLTLMVGLGAVAEFFVPAVLGHQWRQSIPYVQALVVIGSLQPLHALNANLLQVLGRTDLLLRLEIFKKAMSTPFLMAATSSGTLALVAGMVFASVLELILNSYWISILVNYPVRKQIRDLLPQVGMASVVSAGAIMIGAVSRLSAGQTLAAQLLTGAIILILSGEACRQGEYMLIRDAVLRLCRTSYQRRKAT
jgi:teichuronic acid exporter